MRSHPRGCSHSSWACGFRSLSLPSRGSFHLSLAVLVRYRSSPSVQPWGVGPPDSGGVSRVPPYLGYRWAGGGLRARGCHPLRPAFPGRCARRPPCRAPVPLPRRAGPAVWASSAFARRYWRNHYCLLFLRLLRCFTSPGVAPAALWIRAGAPPSRGAGCPIRTPPDRRPHAPPRGFSQLAASFIACRRQGIRRAPVQPGRQKGARPALRAARRHQAPPA